MSARGPLAALPLLALAAAPPAPAQEGEPERRDACRILADAVARARESGAIERALGEHCFLLTRRYWTEGEEYSERWLNRYTVALDEAAGELVVVNWNRAESAGSPNRFEYRSRLSDGRFQSLATRFGIGTVDVAVAGGEVVIARDLEGRESLPDDERQPDRDDLVPKLVGVFVLPHLHDQGLPDRFLFTDVTPYGQVAGPLRLRRLPAAADSVVRFVTDEGSREPTTLVDVATGGEDAGRIVRFVTRTFRGRGDGSERKVAEWDNQRIDPEEFARLRAEMFPADD